MVEPPEQPQVAAAGELLVDGGVLLGALDVGISIDEILTLLDMVNGYVERSVRGEIEWIREMERSGLTPEQWMMQSGPHVRELMNSGDHPMFNRIIKDARLPHMTGDEKFRFGLDRVLDCIAGVLPDEPGGS